MGPAGDIRFSCRQSEENLTGEQGGPDVVPPYAAYAPPGTPQVGLEYTPHCPGPAARLPPQRLHPDSGAAEKMSRLGLSSPSPRADSAPHSIAPCLAPHLVTQQMLTAPAQGRAEAWYLDTSKPDVTYLGGLTTETLHPATQLALSLPTPPSRGLALSVTSSWDQGLLVYANWGSEEDFKELQAQGIQLNGTIALTRYGGVARGAKVSGGPWGRHWVVGTGTQQWTGGGVGTGRSDTEWWAELYLC